MNNPINAFPGYEFKRLDDGNYHNMYRGVDLGKGGWVYSEPGIYTNVALLDVASQHPASIIALNKLGKYTQRYADLRQARVYIKHKDYESAGKLFDGKLKKYLTDTKAAKSLSKALKLPINAFFGVSFASFENPARDSRDNNNIIALRGALFMKTLFDEVDKKGYHTIHCKTDSQKVPNATLEIVQFMQEFAKKYGYEMEHEAVYERMCLIDKAQYVAAYMRPEDCIKIYGYAPEENVEWFEEHSYAWTTTGDKFQHPYIFKTIFSGEEVVFEDMCETKSVKDAAIYLDFNEGRPDVRKYELELNKRIWNESYPHDKKRLDKNLAHLSNDDLREQIKSGHDYRFVGRVGSFFPVRDGVGGGRLLVYRNGKYDSVNGAKGYRWMESEQAKSLGLEKEYDHKYFDSLIDDAIQSINELGSFNRFVDLSRPYEPPDDISPAADDDPPWSVVPCGDGKFNTCMDCPNCVGDVCKRGYSLANYFGGE